MAADSSGRRRGGRRRPAAAAAGAATAKAPKPAAAAAAGRPRRPRPPPLPSRRRRTGRRAVRREHRRDGLRAGRRTPANRRGRAGSVELARKLQEKEDARYARQLQFAAEPPAAAERRPPRPRRRLRRCTSRRRRRPQPLVRRRRLEQRRRADGRAAGGGGLRPAFRCCSSRRRARARRERSPRAQQVPAGLAAAEYSHPRAHVHEQGGVRAARADAEGRARLHVRQVRDRLAAMRQRRQRGEPPFKLALRAQQRRFIREAAVGTRFAVRGDDERRSTSCSAATTAASCTALATRSSPRTARSSRRPTWSTSLACAASPRRSSSARARRARRSRCRRTGGGSGTSSSTSFRTRRPTSSNSSSPSLRTPASAPPATTTSRSTLSAARSARWSSASWPRASSSSTGRRQELVLTENFRSTQNILEAAVAVVRRVANRKEKHPVTQLGDGEPVWVRPFTDDASEANFVANEIEKLTRGKGKLRGKEIAVLSRTWEALGTVDLALRQKKVKVADTKQPSMAEGPKAKPYLWALRLLVSDTTTSRRGSTPPSRRWRCTAVPSPAPNSGASTAARRVEGEATALAARGGKGGRLLGRFEARPVPRRAEPAEAVRGVWAARHAHPHRR